MSTIAAERDELCFAGVPSESVRDATGRGWDEWLLTLDAAGAEHCDCEDIVEFLEGVHPSLDPRWRQSIAFGYEHARRPG